jgi:CobQ-like glutamine amidotransferase family enzyme
MSAGAKLRLCALYPELMNIYADRGNLILLERRCAWRGIELTIERSTIGEQLDGERYDLLYIGGGQDRDQRLCAEDLLERKADGLRASVERGAVLLAVCGGFQLLGRSYEIAPGDELPGVGIFGARTVRAEKRLVGNIAIEVAPQALGGPASADCDLLLAGFENHAGRTLLDEDQAALGRVISGHGNDGRSGLEGAIRRGAIGTYLHGPLLPKNAWLADLLIARALGIDQLELAPLSDQLEHAVHAGALRAAGVRAARRRN